MEIRCFFLLTTIMIDLHRMPLKDFSFTELGIRPDVIIYNYIDLLLKKEILNEVYCKDHIQFILHQV